MKKLLALFLMVLAFALPAFSEDSVVEGGYAAPAPAEKTEYPPLPDDPMLVNAVEIAHRIDLLAESRLFMANFNYAGAPQEMIDAVSAGDHTRPVRAFHLPGDELIRAIGSGMDFTRPELLRDLVGELPELLWGRREDAELSLLGLLSRFKVFAHDAQGCGLYVLLYREAAPVIVTWYAQLGAVSMAAQFMPIEGLEQVADASAMSDWFKAQSMLDVVFEEVPLQ